LLEDKGKELYSFGKVKITLKNFKITSNLDPESFEIVRFACQPNREKYTYRKAEPFLKQAFKEILSSKGDVTFFLALPEGSYYIRSKNNDNYLDSYLSAIYIRANQQQEYFIEPLVDWIIMYENPKVEQPVNPHVKNDKSIAENSNNIKKKNLKDDVVLVNTVNEMLTDNIEQIDITKIFNLRDPWIRSRFLNLTSQVIVNYTMSSRYFNNWSTWMSAWTISKQVTNSFSPGNAIPTELVQLVYNVLVKI
jgi:hypothetical protein